MTDLSSIGHGHGNPVGPLNRTGFAHGASVNGHASHTRTDEPHGRALVQMVGRALRPHDPVPAGNGGKAVAQYASTVAPEGTRGRGGIGADANGLKSASGMGAAGLAGSAGSASDTGIAADTR
jgi:hypothetical protein